MDTWVRDDGRYYYINVQPDLFGLVVVVAHGGRTPPRVHSIPAENRVEAEKIKAELVRRRVAHGYRQVIHKLCG